MATGNALRFGVRIRGVDFDESVELAQRAEALGFDMVVFGDTGAGPALEAWTLATAIAMKTERVRLTHGTLNLPWRYPPFLAKMAASLDVISGGRLDLCVGAGGRLPTIVEEYTRYGITLGTPGERLASVRDFIHIAQGMWTQEQFSYEGARLQVKDAVCLPKPVNGVVPIWVGALLPRIMRLVGELADGWLRNRGWPDSLSEYRAMNQTLDDAARGGRPRLRGHSTGVERRRRGRPRRVGAGGGDPGKGWARGRSRVGRGGHAGAGGHAASGDGFHRRRYVHVRLRHTPVHGAVCRRGHPRTALGGCGKRGSL